jgi:hypothetical protein
MFLLNGQPLQEGTSFTDANGVKYPPHWLNISTEAEKATIGITWVADPVRADDRFYWDGNINNPKALEDVLSIMVDTGEEVVTKGLKSNFVAQVKDTANKLLANTDWYVIRQAERGIIIPVDIITERNAIVTEANRLETAINGVTTVEELIEVLNNQQWN